MLRSLLPTKSIDVTRLMPNPTVENVAIQDLYGGKPRFRRRRFVTLDIICCSHIDTVGKLATYGFDLVAGVSGLQELSVKELLDSKTLFCNPAIYRMVVLDFSRKADRLLNVLHTDSRRSLSLDGEIALLPSRYVFDDFKAFRQLFLDLCITRDELEDALSQVGLPLPPGTVLGIYTDWYDQFNPCGDVDFYGLLELWHPFLLHPFLDLNALRYTLDEAKVAGIATDAPTLEPPVYYCSDIRGVTPNASELRRAIHQGINTPPVELPPNPFLHILTLCSRRLLIESLDFHSVMRPGVNFISGELTIIPMFSDSSGWESIPIRAQFTPD